MAFDMGWKDSIRKGWGPRLTEPVAVGVDAVAYSRMDGRVDGQQLQIQMVGDKYYLFVGHVWSGAITIHDVTNPADPQMVATIPVPNKDTWHIKVQVADNILMTACEGAFMAHGVDIDNAVLGARFFDVSDPTAPKELSKWESEQGGGGVHRSWWNGGKYAYLSAGVRAEGAMYHWRKGRTRVMTTLDISDPTDPKHVSDFWHPVQLGEMEPPPRDGENFGVHEPMVVGDRAYVAYSDGGWAILDISDAAEPRLISHMRTYPELTDGQTHTALPIPERNLVVTTEESMAPQGLDGPKNVRIWDISDETNPKVVSVCPIPTPTDEEPYETFFHKGERFGPHTVHQNHVNTMYSTDKIYGTYHNAGLRIWDISDPANPVETGSFVGPDPTEILDPRPVSRLFDIVHGGVKGYISQDLVVDQRGYIYLTGYNDGLWILKEQ